MIVELDERQLACVLAALRYWQFARDGIRLTPRIESILNIETCDAAIDALSAEEIDDLCEAINGARNASY